MDSQTYQSADIKHLATFLHELNIARRSLTLYPPDHPQVATTSQKTLAQLGKLLNTRSEVTLGVAPDALFFEHQWLDKENKSFLSFAKFLSGLGIASLSFKKDLSSDELIRFSQLLRSDRKTIDQFGGFSLLMEQQQINNVSVVPIDYNAFQASSDMASSGKQLAVDLWEDYLHGLLDDILDLEESGLKIAPRTIAELLNEKLVGEESKSLPDNAISSFVGKYIEKHSASDSASAPLGELLEHLSPHLQESFLAGTFQVLDNIPEEAENVLKGFSPGLLEGALDPNLQQQLANSSRLVEMVGQLAANPSPAVMNRTSSEAGEISKEMVKARLDVLFSEEQHDLFLPETYQSVLQDIFSDSKKSNLPEDERYELRKLFENQSIEQQCAAIIFELLESSSVLDEIEAIQQNLLDLTRFFLDTGDFNELRNIYTNWSSYIHSPKSAIDILDEKVIANHTQHTFMLEVLEGVDVWGEERENAICSYIAAVGEPYTEPIIEQLGQAEQFKRRKFWMKVLEAIGADASQLLISSLSDERWYLIRNLLIILGKNIAPTTLKAVHQLAKHPHPKVRREVIRILFDCNPATANRMLISELESIDLEAQLSAIEIADLSPDPEVLAKLHQLLKLEISTDFDLEYKHQLLATLARIGNRESLSILRHLLNKSGLLTSRRQKQFHENIIQSFKDYPHQEAEKVLQEVSRGSNRQHVKLAQEMMIMLKEEAQ